MKKPAKATDLKINLLPKDPFLTGPLGRLLQWALSAGRYLVIFTELVVVMSFATRFSLDRQVTDLNGMIHQKQVIIESYGDLEDRVRAAQKKIAAYQQVEQQQNLADAFSALSEITPQDVVLDELDIQQDHIVFSGTTRSSVSLNLLVNNIQLSSKFTDITIDKIQAASAQNPGYRFQIQAKLKKTTS